jgi:5'-3' exonuclease
MQCDLIIDGNYILSKNAYYLHKNNLLYGALSLSLNNSINTYINWYPFTNIYLVSDSREKSWRKKLNSSYKGKRKKDSTIDWDFVYNTYQDYKDNINRGIRVLEAPMVEGDDWVSYLCNRANSQGRSTFIISNDYDLKQLLSYNINPLWINIMSNEMYNRQRFFVPNNYKIFIDNVKRIKNDIFNLNDNDAFIDMFKKFQTKSEISEVNSTESLFIKLITGDTSDNIDSAWYQTKNGKRRGIGEKGAKKIYDRYIEEFGDVDFLDSNTYENMADIICESKKLESATMGKIVSNIIGNVKLIDLKITNLPNDIINKMDTVYNG